jgi:excisionase family DNA binding protein
MPAYLSAPIASSAKWGSFQDVEETRRISRSEQYKLIRAGRIVARKLGTKTLIDLQSVDDYISSLPVLEVRP